MLYRNYCIYVSNKFQVYKLLLPIGEGFRVRMLLLWCLVVVYPQGVFYLKGLHEGPQQNANGVALTQKLYEARSSEELQKAHIEATGVHQLVDQKETCN